MADSSAGEAPAPRSRGPSTGRLTAYCLIGLAAGLVLGVGVSRGGVGALPGLAPAGEALVRGWTNAFRLLVGPLVVAQLYLALASHRASRGEAGRLSLAVSGVFSGLLVVTALAAFALTRLLLTWPYFGTLRLDGASVASGPAPVPGSTSGAEWVDGFIPANLVATAATDNILPLMLFTVVFALAVRQADEDGQEVLERGFRAVSQACFTMVGWLLRVTPMVIFALAYRAALGSGLDVGEVILGFAAAEIVIVLAVLLLLYIVTIAAGGISPARLVRGLWPAQLAALGTRSSLATLPALLQAAEKPIGLRTDTAAYVIPVGGAVLKLSRAVTGPVKVLFLGHVLGIPLGAEQLLIFAATIILLSASTVGVPSVTSGNRSLPAYVAAGIPAEYVVLVGVAVNLTDMFLTLLNTSGYMFSAVLVDRLRGRGAPAPLPHQESALPRAPLPVP